MQSIHISIPKRYVKCTTEKGFHIMENQQSPSNSEHIPQSAGSTFNSVSMQSAPSLPHLNTTTIIRKLPVRQRKGAADGKYAKAVSLYASTNLSIREIAEIVGFSPDAVSAHLRRHHRDLILRRYSDDITATSPTLLDTDKIKSPKGQSLITHQKYEKAIEACASSDFIEFNVSEIAHTFNLDPTALASQLKYHFPEILTTRDKERAKLGIAHNRQRGARAESIATYSEALDLYRKSRLSLIEVAEQCKVSPGGFGQFLRFYHKDVIEWKARQRADIRSSKASKPDLRRASGSNAPSSSISDSESTFRKKSASRQKTAADKYLPAIESLRDNPRPIAKVAADFGFNPDVFRTYVRKHCPELHAAQSMHVDNEGRRSKRSSNNKYKEAIDEYLSSSFTMKEIAERRGLVYKSLMSYMKRHGISK